MRRRKSKSSNNPSLSRRISGYRSTMCERCHDEIKYARRPRVNARGRRVATICSLFRGNRRVPVLRLTGKWLAAAGFDIGQVFEIEVQRGKLTILVEAESTEETTPAAA